MTTEALNKAIGGIDHIVIVVDDLERDADIYRRLGFTLSPKGVHSAALGSANHTIMLQRDYFELLTVLAPTDRNGGWRDALAAGGGVAGMAMTTDNAAAAYEYWKSEGLAPDEIIKFSRTVRRPTGPDMEARFEVVSLPNPPGAGLRLFVCSQPTRDAVWLPELMTHANTAQAILGLTVATPTPEASATQWRRLVPGLSQSNVQGGVRMTAGAHFIDLLSPATVQSQLGVTASSDRTRPIAIDYRVADLARCHAVLKSNGVPCSPFSDSLTVAPEIACNVLLRFRQ